jgi:hypothetical protein
MLEMKLADMPKANPDGDPMCIYECEEKQRLSENS